MTTFDDREKSFENKFAHDEELAFRIKARAHKLLGLWAAGKLGKSGVEAENYAKELVMADFEHSGEADIVARLVKDLSGAGTSERDIRVQMEQAKAEARSQIAGNA